MKTIRITPLKTVDGVDFGETKTNVRREFGKFKEIDTKTDDFSWCKVHYDSNNRMKSIDVIPSECIIIVSGTQIDTSSAATAKKKLGLDGNTDMKRSINIKDSNGKLASITFGKQGSLSRDEVKTESIGDIGLPSAIGPDDGSIPGDSRSLSRFYDDLKAKLDQPTSSNGTMIRISPPINGIPSPGAKAYRNMAVTACDNLKEKCCKHILLDIYCNIIPLDREYVAGNQGQMAADIENMLGARGTTARQYITDASNATKAPLLEFVLRSIDMIGRSFMEKANDTIKDAETQDANVPPPETPDIEDDGDVSDSLVDVKKDTEYSNFIEKLKDKTIKKIVADVSKIITDKKEEDDMKFDPKPAGDVATESAFSICMDYFQKKLMMESVQVTGDIQDQMIGAAIREATMIEMDRCFNLPYSESKLIRSRINFGKGAVVNSQTATMFAEAGTQRLESLYKEVDGQKYDVSNYEKVGADGSKTPMSDQEAKKVLDPEGYKAFQSRPKN